MKTKDDIKNALTAVFGEMNNYLITLDDQTFKKSIGKKWSIAENTDHLAISNNITALTLNTPKLLLKQAFKTNKRTNWNYDEVIWKYQRSLNSGAKASLPFQPKLSLIPVRILTEKLWENSCELLLNAINKWSEEDLDTYVIPHPIIGKITVRELLFFTIYHIQHHLKTIKSIS
jgi:DinB superfamily